jgi:hypothetical protein
LLDRELSDDELSFRNQDDYVSKYRRVLEYFDAVKIGLTATPPTYRANFRGTGVYLSRGQQIADRNDNLDISWLRDTSNDPEDELTEPEEIAAAIATHLSNALQEIEKMMEAFTQPGGEA